MARSIPIEDLPVFSNDNPPDSNVNYQKGTIILIDKPKGWSSFDAVKFVRSRIKTKKIGHAGTLDPMATGLLIMCTGKATKSISQIQDLQKEYEGDITFGASTLSYDAESETDEEAPFEHISKEEIEKILNNEFSGLIEQVPPMYSALKYGGRKLYEFAREGKTVKRYPRQVKIYENEVLEFSGNICTIRVVCSKGTYIRSLAHDLGIALGSRAYLSRLVRKRIGDFNNEIAMHPHTFGDILLGKDV